jgi:hypothetical protein
MGFIVGRRGAPHGAMAQRLAVLAAAAVLGPVLTVGTASPAAATETYDCGNGTFNNFYDAFQVWSQACAFHDPEGIGTFGPWYQPIFLITLQSAAPWRFTACTIYWAYKRSPSDTPHRGTTSCKQVIVDMQATGKTKVQEWFCFDGQSCSGSSYVYTRYLELWGHVTVRFDHRDWNAADFGYFSQQ